MIRRSTRRPLVALAALAAAVVTSNALAGDELWIKDDFEKAKKVAAEQGKDLLIDFTGSDWCIWCIRLKDEVFTQSQFKAEAPKDFVLLELDFPRADIQTAEVKAANRKLAEKYEIRGYPTVILATAQGDVYARTGYQAGGAGPYMESLGKFVEGRKKRDAMMDQAKSATGIERAKLLDQILDLKDIVTPGVDKMMAEIIALDAENEAGLKAKYEVKLMETKARMVVTEAEQASRTGDFAGAIAKLDSIDQLDKMGGDFRGEVAGMRANMMVMAGDIEGAMKYIDTVVADETIPVESRQQVLTAKFSAMMQSQDAEGARKAFEAIISLGPDTEFGKMVAGQRESIMQMIDEMAGLSQDTETGVPHDHDGDGKADH